MANGDNAATGTSAPAPGTEEYEKKLNDLAGEMANDAVTKRTKKLERQFDAKFETLQRDFDAKLKALAPAASGGASETGSPNVQLNTVQSELAEVRRRADALEQQNAAMKAAQRQNGLAREIITELQRQGFDAATSEIAFDHLMARGRVGFESDDEDAPVIFKGQNGEALPSKLGIKKWLESDASKPLRPSKTTNGSGSRVQHGLPPGAAGGGPKAAEHFAFNELMKGMGFGSQE